MPKKIKGDLSVAKNTTIKGNNVITNFNGVNADANTGDIDYPFMRTAEIKKTLSMIPISRVGTMDYLPMNISGDFTGATNINLAGGGYGIIPIIVEDDGNMVALRRGTDGNSVNFYYTSQRHVRSSTALAPVPTTEIYRPAYFANNQVIDTFIGTNAYELLMYKTSIGSTVNYAIAVTNGTLNVVSHQAVQFPVSLIDAAYLPQYAHIVKGIIYIWCTTISESADAPFKIKLYTIPVTSVVAGNTNGFTAVTGMSGTDLYNTAYTASPTINITDSQTSRVAGDKPLFLISGADTTGVSLFYNKNGFIQAAGNPADTLIRVAYFRQYRIQGSYTASTQGFYGYSFTYNIATKAIVKDTTAVAPCTASYNKFDLTLNNPFAVKLEDIVGMSSGYFGKVPSICQTSDGFVASAFGIWPSEQTYGLTLTKLPGYTNAFDSWKLPTRKITPQAFGLIAPTFGSELGENFISPRLISSTEMLINCSGTRDDGVSYDYNGLVRASFGSGAPNYQYNSLVQGGTINGFAPQIKRELVDTNLPTNSKYASTISLVEANGTVNVYGTSYVEITNKAINYKMNPSTLGFDSAFNISPTIMANLKTAILANAAIANVDSSNITFYYIPDSSFSKSIAIVKCTTTTRNGWVIIAECDTTVSGMTLTSATMLTTFKDLAIAGAVNPNFTAIGRLTTGLTIGKYAGFSFMYVGDSALFSVPANQYAYGALAKLKGGRISGGIKAQYYTYDASGGTGAGAGGVIPNVGFGLYQLGPMTDYKTKLIFRNYGTTEAAMDAFMANPTSTTAGTPIVILSQEVAQGFVVYFTQEVPTFIAGHYYKIPPTSVDLTSIKANPANTTFYLYVIVNASGVASYHISTTALTEELNRVYIGTVTTGGSAISSITSEKVTRFLTYRPSVTKRGSAIPVSTGVPSSSGTRWK